MKCLLSILDRSSWNIQGSVWTETNSASTKLEKCHILWKHDLSANQNSCIPKLIPSLMPDNRTEFRSSVWHRWEIVLWAVCTVISIVSSVNCAKLTYLCWCKLVQRRCEWHGRWDVCWNAKSGFCNWHPPHAPSRFVGICQRYVRSPWLPRCSLYRSSSWYMCDTLWSSSYVIYCTRAFTLSVSLEMVEPLKGTYACCTLDQGFPPCALLEILDLMLLGVKKFRRYQTTEWFLWSFLNIV